MIRRGMCASCGQYSYEVLKDLGIGSYEYWGARGTHHDWRRVSECCDAEVVEPPRTAVCEACGNDCAEEDGLSFCCAAPLLKGDEA